MADFGYADDGKKTDASIEQRSGFLKKRPYRLPPVWPNTETTYCTVSAATQVKPRPLMP